MVPMTEQQNQAALDREAIERGEELIREMTYASKDDYLTMQAVLALAKKGATVRYALGDAERAALEGLRAEGFAANSITAALNLAVPFTVEEQDYLSLAVSRMGEPAIHGFPADMKDRMLAKLDAMIAEGE